MEWEHVPVLLEEVLACAPNPMKIGFDFTLGLGGHSLSLAQRHPDAFFYGFDRDAKALELAKKRLTPFSNQFQLAKADFAMALQILKAKHLVGDFLLADFGTSSYQMEDSSRGFSFQQEGPIDMRMDQTSGFTAFELIKNLELPELIQILKTYGEEPRAKQIAQAIHKALTEDILKNTTDLAKIIEKSVPFHQRKKKKIHPATLTFQALRIAVNEELNQIQSLLFGVKEVVKKGSVLAVISFHSLEDRFVKAQFRAWEKPCTCPPDFPICGCGKIAMVKNLFNKAIQASDKEKVRNPKSRSARLRAVEFL